MRFIILLLCSVCHAEIITFTANDVISQGQIDGISIVGQTLTSVEINSLNDNTFVNNVITFVDTDVIVTVTIGGTDFIVDGNGSGFELGVNNGNSFATSGFIDSTASTIGTGIDGDEFLTPAIDGETYNEYLTRTGQQGISFTEEFGRGLVSIINGSRLNGGTQTVTALIIGTPGAIITVNSVGAVPEPSTYVLLVIGLGLFLVRRK